MTHRARPDRTHPTQVRYPWRSTIRGVLVAAIALLPALPEIAHAVNIETVPTVAAVLGLTAALQRVIAIPEVDTWLATYLKLGAQNRKEYDHDRQA